MLCALHVEVVAAVEVLLDGGGGLEVGDGAGHLEDAVVGAGTHVHAFHGIAYEHTLVRTRMAKSYLC